LLGSAVLCALVSFIINYTNNYTTTELAAMAELKLHDKELVAQKHLDQVSLLLRKNKPKDLFKIYNGSISDLYKTEGIALYVYSNDSLVFWSDNQPAVDLYPYAKTSNNYYFASESVPDMGAESDTSRFSVQLIKIRNGWYECIRQKDTTQELCTMAALILIKPEYDFENSYIDNNFSKWIGLPVNTKLTTDFNYANPSIQSVFGKTLFEIRRSDGIYKGRTVNTYAILFAIASGFIFLFFSIYCLRNKVRNKITLLVIFTTMCFVGRTLMIWFKFPGIFYNSMLYDASVFADASSFYFSYMGDVLFNSVLIFMVAVFIYKLNYDFTRKSTAFNLTALFFATLYTVCLYYTIPILIDSLVNNSTISYNINELFDFKWLSLLGLLSVALLFFSFYLVAEKAIISLLLNNKLTPFYNSLFFATVCLTALIVHYRHLSYSNYLWPVPLLVISYFLRKYKASYNFINIGLIILVSTLITFTLFTKYEQLNKQRTYDALSLNLTDRQDVIAENEFTKIITSIQTDFKLKNLLSLLPLSAEQVEQRIRQVNFSGYFERYEVEMALFKGDSTSVFGSADEANYDENYFKKQVSEDGFQTISDNLYFIDKDKKPIRYIAEIDIEDISKNPEKTFRLYLQLEPKLAVNLGAFPDLLLDKSIESKLQSTNISYALYESNKLLTAHGDYEYPLFQNKSLFDLDKEYTHYRYNYQKNIDIIISDRKFDFWQKFTFNSYLFLFFSLIVLSAIFFNSTIVKRIHNLNSLNIRIQFIFVSIVILSLAGVVIGTVWIVNSQFEGKNEKELLSKSRSVLRELKLNMGDLTTLEASHKDYTAFSLKKLAPMFGSDISVFTRKGNLYATSQPAIYDQGLLSRFMNPDAFSYFSKQIRASYTHRESIGSLKYLSAYIPFYSNNDVLLGYINLPYFARQKDLEKELTAYLTTLINIYSILFVITTMIALLLSNLLTKPLRIIRQQISNIKFGSRNESIDWQADDEIGQLIKEYNNMLLKLEKNSELLAQSERESAWREMAKQVAHEIKNPLTPMKLNIQHLQRIALSNPDDMAERVNKVSEVLIEQIDTLSHIATEFSNFAKLPKTNPEIINVNEVLKNVAHLFKQNTDCEIKLYITQSQFILADREQCLRIFTNMLKNAEQAIPADRQGKIEIITFSNETEVIIKIRDNGCGIPDELRSRMFTPNFTTKTTGTGLGLAMVKNYITAFGGNIFFETVENEGTTFTISLPKAIS
jgi:signal transduction histidine kinase